MTHCISWTNNTSRCKKLLDGTKPLFHGGRAVTVLSLALLFMLAPFFPPSFPLHFWLVPIDRVWGREERGDNFFSAFLCCLPDEKCIPSGC